MHSKFKIKSSASEQIYKLFEQAEQQFNKKPELSHKYVKLARRLSMHYKIKIPEKYKRRFCKKCLSFLMPSKNARIRTKNGKVIITCLNCKRITRIPVR